MIVVDNCILSSLSKINRLDLLSRFKEVCTIQGVLEEAMNSDIESVMDSVLRASKKWLSIKHIAHPQNLPEIRAKHQALSFTDCELILLSKENDCPLLTDDTKLIEIAEKKFGIEVFDLFDLLMVSKKKGIIASKDIEKIILELRKKDNYEFPKAKLIILRSK